MNTATPRDLLALKRSVEAAAELGSIFARDQVEQVAWIGERLRPIPDLLALIEKAIEPEPSGSVGEGGVIRPGFSPELDRTRSLSRGRPGGSSPLWNPRNGNATGIRNLKVGFNQVFGYYIEVSNSNLESVPDHYQRRQTLTGGERYITPELKEFERQALEAREQLEELERSLYRQVCRQVADHGPAISRLASAIARADVFVGLADVAVRHGYVRPELNDGRGNSQSRTAGIRWWSGCWAPGHSCPMTRPWIPTMPRSCSSPVPTWPASPPTSGRSP